MIKTIQDIVRQTREKRPMVHAITNNVTVNDCANIILAAYGAPTMAQDTREVEEITALSDALVLNLGALRAQEAMLLAGKKANELGHPIVLDPVAAGASFLRGETCRKLLHELRIAVIRGNASEIRALALGSETTLGVEVNALDKVTEDNLEASAEMVRAFSRRVGAVVALTGEIDLVTDGTQTAVLRGGCEMMSRITGAGCMLTALTGAYCGANPDRPFAAAVAAVAVMDACGEAAYERVREAMEGTASFRTRLLDAVSLLNEKELETRLQLQIL
ncbi:hydroxyethylthiazole kinase [Intestinibacillus sp. Marseille-P6563]|uniref:hydroxyethylthiazole kinase n=1 Tax=Intestinibacillus sp. Marseille-P6563 TaxID=2364792 RepID=UPI002ED179CA